MDPEPLFPAPAGLPDPEPLLPASVAAACVRAAAGAPTRVCAAAAAFAALLALDAPSRVSSGTPALLALPLFAAAGCLEPAARRLGGAFMAAVVAAARATVVAAARGGRVCCPRVGLSVTTTGTCESTANGASRAGQQARGCPAGGRPLRWPMRRGRRMEGRTGRDNTRVGLSVATIGTLVGRSVPFTTGVLVGRSVTTTGA